MSPQLENPKGISLPSQAAGILKTMFPRYERVVIKDELQGGLSGSRVFLVRLIKRVNGDNHPHLPVVVKVASASLIEKEWQAYVQYVHNRLPQVAEIRGQPVLSAETGWGGLCYPLLGGGTFDVVSLHRYVRQASLENIRFVTGERLLRLMEQMVQFNRPCLEFYLESSYDRLLPVNLLIKPQNAPGGEPVETITPNHPSNHNLKPGQYVRVEGFKIAKVDLIRHTITLNRPVISEKTPGSFVIRLQSPGADMTALTDQAVGGLAIEGVILKTRQSQLLFEAQSALGPEVDLSQAFLTLPNGQRLPNPLLVLSKILDESRDIRVGQIHGDLNLENILIDPVVRDVTLIDFTEARQDHILIDFLKLETEIMTKFVAELLARHHLSPATAIPDFYHQLHQATFQDRPTSAQLAYPVLEKPLVILELIRKTARRYLFDFYDPTEYYQGLLLHLIGALKFRNLSVIPEAPLPKQVAFWAAAAVFDIILELSNAPGAFETRVPTHNSQRPAHNFPLVAVEYRNGSSAEQADAGQEQLSSQAVTNPYIGRAMITDTKMFFGREIEIDTIFSRVATLQSYAIVGNSRIGKSSMLYYFSQPEVYQKQLPDPAHYVFSYLNLQVVGQPTKARFFSQVYRKFAADSGGRLRTDYEPSYDGFRAFIEDSHNDGWKLVLGLDEFEIICGRGEFDNDFFTFLRGLANGYNLAYVTASRTGLHELCHTGKVAASEFWNIFATLYLEYFKRDEAYKLVTVPFARSLMTISTTEIDFVLQLARNHPLLVQIACYHLFDLKVKDQLRLSTLEDRFIREATTYLAKI